LTQDVNALGGKKTRDGILRLSVNLMVAEAAENAERRLESRQRTVIVFAILMVKPLIPTFAERV